MVWIDAKKMIPINGVENVLVTCENELGRYVIADAMWDHGKWLQLMEQSYELWCGEEHGYEYHPDVYTEIKDSVVAWMLQPEPYGG